MKVADIVLLTTIFVGCWYSTVTCCLCRLLLLHT